MKIRILCGFLAASIAAAPANTVEYNFDDSDGVVDANDFPDTTAGDWSIVTANNGNTSYNTVHDGTDGALGTDVKARVSAVTDDWTQTMSFTLTIGATAIDLTDLDFEFGFDDKRINKSNLITPTWRLQLAVGGGNTLIAGPAGIDTYDAHDITGGFDYFLNDPNPTHVDLSGLTDLANTTVTFTWEFDTPENRANGDRRYCIDDVVLSGSVVPVDDTDDDDLPDYWEELFFPDHPDPLDPLDGKADGSGALPGQPNPGSGDYDGDGLLDVNEYNGGVDSTDPTNEDSDGDGFHDKAETRTGTWVAPGYDYATNRGDLGTLPNNPDQDDDDLLDGYENNTGTFVSVTRTGTSPYLKDTDGDTLLDGWEVNDGHGLIPTDDTDPNGETHDPDFDTLPNWEEQDIGTHPNDPDTDDDGLNDDVEYLDTETDPTDPDHDDDGLKDGDEDLNGDGILDPGETDPKDPDSDDDTFSDGDEVADGSDPRLATSIPSFALFFSPFDANTGATPLAGNADDTSGSASLTITDWITNPPVTAISDLTVIVDGDSSSGSTAGFVQLQTGPPPADPLPLMSNPDTAYINRNHNQEVNPITSKRGYSLTFTIDSTVSLGTLIVISGHADNTGASGGGRSDLNISLSGGSLGTPVTFSRNVDYQDVDFEQVSFDLTGTTLQPDTYTLEVYQSGLPAPGGYASYNGISLASGLPVPRITGVIHDGAGQLTLEIENLVENETYHLETGVTLEDFAPLTDSEFDGDGSSPQAEPVDVTGTTFFVRVVSGPIP